MDLCPGVSICVSACVSVNACIDMGSGQCLCVCRYLLGVGVYMSVDLRSAQTLEHPHLMLLFSTSGSFLKVS